MITGFTISKVEGRVDSIDALAKQRFPKLNYNIDSLSGAAEKIKINYEFSATYFDSDAKEAKSIGELKLSGAVEIKETKENVSSIVKKWNESHLLPPQLAEEILNSLNFRCGATGTLVAYSLGLIPPLVISTTKIEEKK
jgi:hypothetical protein